MLNNKEELFIMMAYEVEGKVVSTLKELSKVLGRRSLRKTSVKVVNFMK